MEIKFSKTQIIMFIALIIAGGCFLGHYEISKMTREREIPVYRAVVSPDTTDTLK